MPNVTKRKNKNDLGLYYDVRFKDIDSLENLPKVKAAIKNSVSKFQIISVNTEISVYKLLNYLHDYYGFEESDIKTVDALALESYLNVDSKHQFNVMQIRSLIEDGVLKDAIGKWLVVPNFSCEWTPKLLYLFYNEIKRHGVIGLIFHSDEGRRSFLRIAVEQTALEVVQFPLETITTYREIEDDGW